MSEVSEIYPKPDRAELVPTHIKLFINGSRRIQDFFIGCARLFGADIKDPERMRVIDNIDDL